MSDDATFTTVLDAVGRVCSEALGEGHVFAAGITEEVMDADPLIEPMSDGFTEAGMPACTLALGKWRPILKPGHERMHVEILGAIWRPRLPLDEAVQGLLGDSVRLTDAFIAHAYAFGHESTVQSVILLGGDGMKARALPRRGGSENTTLYLTLPFKVEATLMRSVVPQPA